MLPETSKPQVLAGSVTTPVTASTLVNITDPQPNPYSDYNDGLNALAPSSGTYGDGFRLGWAILTGGVSSPDFALASAASRFYKARIAKYRTPANPNYVPDFGSGGIDMWRLMHDGQTVAQVVAGL